MKFFRYLPWDGTQLPFALKRKEVMDAFMENIMKGMNPNMSLAQMIWDGFPLAGMDFRVMGLEEMLKEIQQQKRDLFSQYNLEKAFDKPIDDLKRLMAEEAMTRQQKGEESSPLFEDLPPGLLEKIKSLENFPFMNEFSQEAFNSWKERRDEVLELYEFYSEYSHKFQGDESLDFDQALELMRQFKSLDNLQKQLLNGQFQSIDPKMIKDLMGEEASRSFAILLQLPEVITEEGIITFDKAGFHMTPKGMRALGELAFGQVYFQVKKDKQGGHLGEAPQSGEIEPDSSRPYQFGDRFDLDITKTILNAVSRPPMADGRLHLSPEDFYVREREQRITSTTVILLDLSWSMSWEGRFHAAKRVALALDHYIRTRFPKDKFYIIGFSTEARELKGKELALAVWDWGQAYTNLQGALRLAMKFIKRSGNRNNRVTVITDGQPTAYYIGSHLHVELPNSMFGISPNACKATLAEIRKVTAQGMNIDTFMLDDNPVLVEFIRQISKINGGRAIICVPDSLGELVFVEEIKRRGQKI
ncbi:MAG: VWA domain-containing protein [Deltaproteobacteria bacterium]|nr:VWA domain-containing protein [Deltaproteobacteria bacterium]MBW2051082.1 VWA domain-containing protein [Deltaproteobacteria bacterium]MBW2141050.1 VWA domain-containing protein [Deltaproteobacteria bacterium]MBW2322592.1 VWA domain-containing protein [Deltaproteobacteria bacterium]